jgi:glycosyltransferase involved in cell wall biosynthesis
LPEPWHRICVPGASRFTGGPRTFVSQLSQELNTRGIGVSFDPSDYRVDAVLVVGGTRHIEYLLRSQRRGIRVVQRLGALNWIQTWRTAGLSGFLRSRARNYITTLIRNHLSHHIVYQSQFSRDWWERVRGVSPVPATVVHNGVDLDMFQPTWGASRRAGGGNTSRIAIVEGRLDHRYDQTLSWAMEACRLLISAGQAVQLIVAGSLSSGARKMAEDLPSSTVLGSIPRSEVATLFSDVDCHLSIDVNPACPNSVIEALASGTPVVGFATGALPEILDGRGGLCIEYGGNPWRLERPDVAGLAEALFTVLADSQALGKSARMLAEERFDLRNMVDRYCEILFTD